MSSSLADLRFERNAVDSLPVDIETRNFQRQVMDACLSLVSPTAVSNPTLLALSPEAAELIGLDPGTSPQELAEILSGNRVLPDMEPYASCYGGHQFGNWAYQLGDGRAITLGEVIGPEHKRWELQLKGSGPTPYSRQGDGRAVMRSSVREFMCSEAMHHLGVPTTRALSLVDTGDPIVRDMFYSGDPRPEPGAVVCRMAPSFLRFGNFEIHANRGKQEPLEALGRYALEHLYPELGPPGPEAYVALFAEVARRNVDMVVHWMRVGFVHGVMNTDNMSMLGLTIDYGPYGWLEGYDPNWTPNTTDAGRRRYRFGGQPRIVWWNLACLGHALLPLAEEAEPLQKVLDGLGESMAAKLATMQARKLGLPEGPEGADGLFPKLNSLLQGTETDMTIFFRRLSRVPSDESASDEALLSPLADAYYVPTEAEGPLRADTLAWLRLYTERARSSGIPDEERRRAMDAVNPKYVLRNYLAQLAIDGAEKGDPSKLLELMEVLRRPYDEQPQYEEYAAKRPEWARNRPGCSMLSCSS